MDRETVIRLARECQMPHLYQTGEILNIDRLERFANHVAQHEREECAKVCDDINAKYKWPDDVAERVASQWCADAIRTRGNT